VSRKCLEPTGPFSATARRSSESSSTDHGQLARRPGLSPPPPASSQPLPSAALAPAAPATSAVLPAPASSPLPFDVPPAPPAPRPRCRPGDGPWSGGRRCRCGRRCRHGTSCRRTDSLSSGPPEHKRGGGAVDGGFAGRGSGAEAGSRGTCRDVGDALRGEGTSNPTTRRVAAVEPSLSTPSAEAAVGLAASNRERCGGRVRPPLMDPTLLDECMRCGEHAISCGGETLKGRERAYRAIREVEPRHRLQRGDGTERRDAVGRLRYAHLGLRRPSALHRRMRFKPSD